MDLVFCGTPNFAVPSLHRLVEAGFQVRLVVTQPDRPRGRGLEPAFSPVKRAALEHSLSLAQPEKIKNNVEFRRQLEEIAPRAIIVVGYGRLIPRWMLELPPLGNINLHASLLPKYRGAAPIQWAIANGEIVTGNTTMRLDEGLDTGDILLQQETPITAEDTAITLSERLGPMGAELLHRTLDGLEAGTVQPLPQHSNQATEAPILSREDGRVNFSRTATEIWNRLRGFQPWPGAFTTFRGRTLHIISAHPMAEPAQVAPSCIQSSGDSLLVGCGQQTLLRVDELQPEGKRRISARDFLNGYRPSPGERLGAQGS